MKVGRSVIIRVKGDVVVLTIRLREDSHLSPNNVVSTNSIYKITYSYKYNITLSI